MPPLIFWNVTDLKALNKNQFYKDNVGEGEFISKSVENNN